MRGMSRVVIVGAGHGAGQVAATLLHEKFAGSITMIGEERWYPYQRPPLSKKFLAGEMTAERLHFKPESFYKGAVDVILGTRVTAIDRDSRQVATDSGSRLAYDALVLATGSRVRRLDIDGSDLDGIHYLRGIDDADAIRADAAPGRRIVIVGAGYIGLEVAAVATGLGLDVTVVEMESRVMSRVVSPELSAYYRDVHAGHGVKVLLSTGVTGFSGHRRVEGVVVSSGETVPADLVVVGIGIVPNVELAAACDLDVADGIVVDDHCRTRDPHVYAIGDCTWHPNPLLGRSVRLESVHNALEQAKTAALNICGKNTAYAQVPWFWSDQYDLKLQIAGLSQGYDQAVTRGDPAARSFAVCYLRKGVLIAVDAVNSPKDFIQAKPLIAQHAVIDPALLANTDVPVRDMA